MAQIRAGIEKGQPVIGLPYAENAEYTENTENTENTVYTDVVQLFVSGSLVWQFSLAV